MYRHLLACLPIAVTALALLACGTQVYAQSMSVASSPVPPAPENWQSLAGSERLSNLLERRTPDVSATLQLHGFEPGNPVFLRIIKESHELELWLQAKDSKSFRLFKTYPIARWSGALGPKEKEGDRQAPEGFYSVDARRMNPQSRYHLSFNIGYPNAYDLAHKRTGALLMVHGKDVSIGCYAMTDPAIEEIYLIVHTALAAGQPAIAVHCYPFRMSDERLAQASGPWLDFWRNLKQGWDRFEQTHQPPRWSVKGGRYVFP